MSWKHAVLLPIHLLAIVLAASCASAVVTNQTVGLFLNEDGAFDGYTLFQPTRYGTAYLIDNEGRQVHSWDIGAGATPYLLPDGSVIHASDGGARQLSWDGEFTWVFNPSVGFGHHDLEVLPNGNVLMIMRETLSEAEAIAAGRDPALLVDGELWSEFIIEVQPTGPTSGEIVWEWHAWDHLVQDHDPTKDNIGIVADHPELIDVNFSDPLGPAGQNNWLHANGIDYNEEFDQIVLSIRLFSEIWVIDHSTTTDEAARHSGGNGRKGGDLLYRWGNPRAYRAGGPDDQVYFHQHDAQWIEAGFPGEGNILVFNNGNRRPGPDYSSVDEIVLPVDALGNYALTPGEAYGPVELTWTYAAEDRSDFYSFFISGAVRLANGNTLIDSGALGTFFEVTPDGRTVWEYVNPVTGEGPLEQGCIIGLASDGFSDNIVFRAYRYAPDSPAFTDRDLSPGAPIEIPKQERPREDPAAATDSGTVPTGVDVDDDADACPDVAGQQTPPSPTGSGTTAPKQ